jgi:hypothetical protein
MRQNAACGIVHEDEQHEVVAVAADVLIVHATNWLGRGAEWKIHVRVWLVDDAT